MTPILPQWKSG